MVPFPILPTQSTAEKRLYERFLEQLDDAYVVYHSVNWVLAGPRGRPIEGEADFLIAHPVDGVFVLEVKGGRLEFDPASKTWRQTGRSGTHTSKDPFKQAQDGMHSLMDILEAQPGYRDWRPSFGFGVAFPDGTYDAPAHPGAPVEVTVDRRHLDALAPRVQQVMRHWRPGGRRFGAEGMEALAQALGFRVEVRTPLGVLFGEEDRRIVELTNEQAWVLTYITNLTRAAVTGPAGSGKTVLAVQMATRLGASGKQTLLTCFNKALAADLRDRVADAPGVTVRHFHELAWTVAEEAGVKLPEKREEPDGSTFFDVELPHLLEEAAERLGPRFDAIVVDEGQDFHEHWWPALLALHRDPDDGPLYVFADDNQNLYGGAIPVKLQASSLPLPHNLRNTKEIHEFVSVFSRGRDPVRAKGPHGRAVEVLDYEGLEGLTRLLEVVLVNLEEEGVPLEHVVLLTPSRKSRSELRGAGRAGRFEMSDTPEPGKLLAATVHAFKGLERPVVILAEVQKRHMEELERYLYVGGSRARNHLIVLAEPEVARHLRDRVREAARAPQT